MTRIILMHHTITRENSIWDGSEIQLLDIVLLVVVVGNDQSTA